MTSYNSMKEKKQFKKIPEVENYTTFERCPHDKEHPFLMVDKKLIRNEKISPNARWLIMYLLCNKEGWKINFKQIYNHVKEHLGRDKIYEVLNECIEHGYLKREEYVDDENLLRIRYFISEYPKFKKSLRHPEFQDAENPDPENQEHNKNIESFQDSNKTKVNNNTEKPVDNFPLEKKKSYEQKASAVASDLATFLFQEIKKRMPKFKQPNMQEWAITIDRMIRLDKRESFEIMEVMSWLKNDDWYAANILSPNNLRKRFDDIKSKMMYKDKKALVNYNRQYAIQMKKTYSQEMKGLMFNEKSAWNCYDTESGKEASLDLPHETFKKILLSLFGGTLRDVI